jgi:hypothetical protein
VEPGKGTHKQRVRGRAMDDESSTKESSLTNQGSRSGQATLGPGSSPRRCDP